MKLRSSLILMAVVLHRVVGDEPVTAVVIWAPGGEIDRIAGFFEERPVEPQWASALALTIRTRGALPSREGRPGAGLPLSDSPDLRDP